MKNPYSKLNTLKEINPTGLSEASEGEMPEYLKKNPGHKVLNVGSGNTTLVDNRIVHMDIFVIFWWLTYSKSFCCLL